MNPLNTNWRERNAEVNKRYAGRVMTPEETRRELAGIFPGGFHPYRIAQNLGNIDQDLRAANPDLTGAVPSTATPGTTTPAAAPVVDEATLKKQQLATQLAQALRGQGVNWNYTAGGNYAPPASMLGGQAWSRVKNMPSLFMLLKAAASQSGQSEADYMAEVNAFAHAPPQYPQVTYR